MHACEGAPFAKAGEKFGVVSGRSCGEGLKQELERSGRIGNKDSADIGTRERE